MSGLCVAALEIRFWEAVANEPGYDRSIRNPMDLCTPAGMALLGLLLLGHVAEVSWVVEVSWVDGISHLLSGL